MPIAVVDINLGLDGLVEERRASWLSSTRSTEQHIDTGLNTLKVQRHSWFMAVFGLVFLNGWLAMPM